MPLQSNLLSLRFFVPASEAPHTFSLQKMFYHLSSLYRSEKGRVSRVRIHYTSGYSLTGIYMISSKVSPQVEVVTLTCHTSSDGWSRVWGVKLFFFFSEMHDIILLAM